MQYWLDRCSFTYASLGRAIERSDVTVGAWCKDKYPPSPDSLDAACSAMGITLSQFWADPLGALGPEQTAAEVEGAANQVVE